ncbi:MAG: hypothetical protein NTW84_03385, partial [Methanothrix sp.]|nr:hypothetical protein [Methanothrix sp.]
MTDMAVISTILGSVKTATDIAKLIIDSGNTLEKAELKLRLAELISNLADTKIKVTEVQELLNAKNTRIQELEVAFQTKENLVRFKDAYYKVNDAGSPVGEPYCMKCWQVEHKAYELHVKASRTYNKVCPVCNTEYDA